VKKKRRTGIPSQQRTLERPRDGELIGVGVYRTKVRGGEDGMLVETSRTFPECWLMVPIHRIGFSRVLEPRAEKRQDCRSARDPARCILEPGLFETGRDYLGSANQHVTARDVSDVPFFLLVRPVPPPFVFCSPQPPLSVLPPIAAHTFCRRDILALGSLATQQSLVHPPSLLILAFRDQR
jgi:hypothetical protein